ncbi:hypothetical protein GALMADRAFT_417612 [Galerina marginata CBS 339.88]|uniref:FHA domain-containing protein n=1 Tax=Galerina marginata (strain CBS 339.88) TaxID=685588 RepID=A0A067TAH3_GALM3|nr:hypothetical protein GALMADRAFT_417612 [Galerina marginata CBS 339.88]
MDTSGFSQVGRYGTLSLLKRRTSGSTSGPASNSASKDTTPSPEQPQVVTSFGIDSANLTFGRAPTCDVRLYYSAIDPVHCRVVNEDGKAFLVVQGKAGALVDGYWVYPHTSSSSPSNSGSNEQQQSIIPLTNNCEFEIHGKRFRFTYPPKEVRKILLATPVAQRNRTLRLSMIQSAQVFSPRPSHDPRENLKILQSPIKASIFSSGSSGDTSARSRSQSPSKPRAVSPLKFGIAADESDSDDEVDMEDEHNESEGRGREDSGESIVLVHTNHPRVVEEERDLVILEDVPLHLILPSPSVYSAGSPARPGPQQTSGAPGTPTPMQHSGRPAVVQPQPQRAQAQLQPPRTPPRRKSMGGTALHRAVLIRSAQRAVWKAEKEREEEEYEDEDVEMRSASDDDEEYTDEEDEDNDNKSDQKPLWRKSLERIIPWPFGGKKEDGEEEDEEHDGNGDEDDQEEDEEDAPTPLPTMPQQTPARRVLGSFMTPQPQARQPAQQPKRDIFPSSATNNAETSTTSTIGPATGPGRYSLGGGEARRVIVQQPWRVRDLVVPPLVQTSVAPSAPAATSLRSVDPPTTPGGAQFLPGPGTSATKPPVTEVERRAIQERRRSAAREIRENPFWRDGAPGMSPAKIQPSPAKPNPGLGVGQGSARPSVMASPAKLGSGSMGVGMTPKRPAQASPTKGRSLGYSIAEAEGEEGGSPFLDSNVNGKATSREPAKRVDDDEESLDAHSLLERMRETVESMKRRRSVLPPATPKAAMVEEVNSGFGVDDKSVGGTIKKLDFTRVTPAAGRRAVGTPSVSESTPKVVSQTRPSSPSKPAQPSLDEDDTQEPEAFSLLRPGARHSLAAKMIEKPSAVEDKVHAVLLPPPVIVIDTADDGQDEEQTEAKARGRGRGRPRMLRAPKDEEEPTQAEDEEIEEVGSFLVLIPSYILFFMCQRCCFGVSNVIFVFVFQPVLT